jgi:hypothetical protein
VSSVSASSSRGSPAATGAPGPGANHYTVTLNGVENQQYVAVTLRGVQVGASSIPAVQGTIGVLLGDTNEGRSVNSGDAQQTRSRSGQVAADANFRSEVNVDGAINSGDAFIVRR